MATPWRRRDLTRCGALTRLPTLGQCPQKVPKSSGEDLCGACENKDLRKAPNRQANCNIRHVKKVSEQNTGASAIGTVRSCMNSVLSAFDFLFGCHHSNLS